MKNNTILIGTALMLTAGFALPVASLGQNGSLDLSFDTDGKVTTAIGITDDKAYSVAIQSDGKIVLAGYSRNGTISEFALVRYNTNGSLDNTFNADGKVTTAIGTSYDYATSVAIQSDGKIVLAGSSENGTKSEFALVRYNTNGSLDSTFDTDGKVTTAIGTTNASARSVAIQSDGKIVLAGYSSNDSISEYALVRYNTNGSLDNTFDTDGKVTTAIGTNSGATSVAIQSDGKIVLAGYSINSTKYEFALVRYNTNGSLDNTFDADGKVTTAIGTTDADARSVAIQSDGKIVLVGSSSNDSITEFALVRYNTNGSLDNTFDTDGKVTTAIGTEFDIATSVAIQSDGKIVLAGFSINGNKNEFSLVRYNINGSLDNTFDTDGKVTTAIGISSAYARSVAIQSDGKIVLAGYSKNGTKYEFALVRYNNSTVEIENVNNIIFETIVFPNPFSKHTTFKTNTGFNEATLSVYNSNGQLVKQISNLTGQTFTFQRDNLTNGMYFTQLTQDNKIIFKNKLVITN